MIKQAFSNGHRKLQEKTDSRTVHRETVRRRDSSPSKKKKSNLT